MSAASCTAIAQFCNRHNLVVTQPILDFADTVALHKHHKNLPYDTCCFRVWQKVISVVWVCDIAIWNFPIDTFASLGFCLFDGSDFLRSITGVKLVSQPYIKNDKKAVQWRSITFGETVWHIIGSGYR